MNLSGTVFVQLLMTGSFRFIFKSKFCCDPFFLNVCCILRVQTVAQSTWSLQSCSRVQLGRRKTVDKNLSMATRVNEKTVPHEQICMVYVTG